MKSFFKKLFTLIASVGMLAGCGNFGDYEIQQTVSCTYDEAAQVAHVVLPEKENISSAKKVAQVRAAYLYIEFTVPGETTYKSIEVRLSDKYKDDVVNENLREAITLEKVTEEDVATCALGFVKRDEDGSAKKDSNGDYITSLNIDRVYDNAGFALKVAVNLLELTKLADYVGLRGYEKVDLKFTAARFAGLVKTEGNSAKLAVAYNAEEGKFVQCVEPTPEPTPEGGEGTSEEVGPGTSEDTSGGEPETSETTEEVTE